MINMKTIAIKYVGGSHFREISEADFGTLGLEQAGIRVASGEFVAVPEAVAGLLLGDGSGDWKPYFGEAEPVEDVDEDAPPADHYDDMNKEELLAVCKELGLSVKSGATKEAIIDGLRNINKDDQPEG